MVYSNFGAGVCCEDDNPRICIPLSAQRWIQNMSRPSNHCAQSLSKRHGKAIDDHACLGLPIYFGLDGKVADFSPMKCVIFKIDFGNWESLLIK
jgi:hypothetical protein